MRTMQTSDETLSAYFRSIRHIRLLSREEEEQLAHRISKGDEKARQRLIEANLRLVVRVAHSMWNPSLSLADMIQEGNIGLMKAAQKFDGDRNVRFSTYAVWWIRQSISRAIINTGRTIRLPHRKEQLVKKIHAEKNALSQSLKRAPTQSELSVRVGIPENTMQELLAMAEMVSGFDLAREENQETLSVLDTYEDYTYAPEKAFSHTVLREQTNAMLSQLGDRERCIIEQRFEINGKCRKSLKNMGKDMNLSPETVRHIEKKALQKLQIEAEKGYLCLTA